MNNRIILKAILTILTLVLSHNICEAQTKRTIHVATAGTLPELISKGEKYQIEELTLTGELNGTDLKFIREMAGSSVWTDSNCDIYLNADGERAMIDASPIGKLTTLDISGSNLIAGGDSYYGKSEDGTITLSCYLKNDNELPPYVFYRSRLSSIILPNSLISIDDGALSYCIGLISITIPQNVTRIGGGIDNNQNSYYHMYRGESGVFYGCNGLQEIYTKITNPFHISENTFPGGIYSNAELIVPKGTKAAYQSTEGWSNFANIVEDGGAEQEVVQTKRTIHVATAGTLSSYISESEKYQIEELTLTGEINGTDFGFLREMAGKNIFGKDGVYNDTDGKLSSLDMAGATVIAGGGYYYVRYDSDMGKDEYFYLYNDNEIPYSVFRECEKLRSIAFPNSVQSIGDCAFWYCSGLTSINIPNSVTKIGLSAFVCCTGLTSITIPNSVTSIGGDAFYGCSGLTSITIPNSVTSIGDDAFYGCSGLTSITIPNSVTSIKSSTFSNCNGLTTIKVESGNLKYDSRDNCNAIIESATNTLLIGCKNTTIPNSVTSIGSMAFWYCSGLTSITIPKSVSSIDNYAFSHCSDLASIISEIENPFAIDDNTFYSDDKDVYATATLTVPAGTKSFYQSTGGWKNFKNIVEEGSTDVVEFTIDGTTYQGSKLDKTVMVQSVDPSLTSLEIPASVSYDGTNYQVTGNDDHAFDGSTMAALIWDVEAALSSKAFNNANIGSNFLLYVRSASYAPSSVKNVVVNGSAQSIVLSDDGGQFYCPQAFTAEKISYTHYYNMETGGEGKGWETIALPFNVQKISHSTRGEIIPFASYSSGSSEKPFWLANMSSSGFRRTSNIQSNEPYIIAMPNNNSYQNDYILTGEVTFSAENASVPKTPTFSGKFVPTFSTVSKSSNVYALNAVNKYVNATGGYDAGSRFISNLRDVRPFEAYISSSSSTRGVIEIDFDDDKMGLDNILFSTDESREVTIYTISGRKVGNTQKDRLDETIEQLPKGVYMVNGRKIVK